LVKEGYGHFDCSVFLEGYNWSSLNNALNVSDNDCGYCSLDYYKRDHLYDNYRFLTAEQYLGIGKNNKIIMNKITSQIKRIFNSSLQKQYKAGLIDNCGDLTDLGREELNGLIRDTFNDELTKIAEEIIKEEKEDK